MLVSEGLNVLDKYHIILEEKHFLSLLVQSPGIRGSIHST